MSIIVKASDLKFKYPRDSAGRFDLKFSGLPDTAPFNRDDLYEILPMMSAVMDELGSNDGDLLSLEPRRTAVSWSGVALKCAL